MTAEQSEPPEATILDEVAARYHPATAEYQRQLANMSAAAKAADKAGVPRVEIAARLGVSRTTVYKWCDGTATR